MSPSVAGTRSIEGCGTRSKTRVKLPGGRAAFLQSGGAPVPPGLCAVIGLSATRTVATKALAASAAPTHRTTRERNCILWNILSQRHHRRLGPKRLFQHYLRERSRLRTTKLVCAEKLDTFTSPLGTQAKLATSPSE